MTEIVDIIPDGLRSLAAERVQYVQKKKDKKHPQQE